MTLDDKEAVEILKKSKQVPQFILDARKRTKTLTALFQGDDFKTELSKVEHIEKSADKWRAREKYSRSIIDLNERVFRPLDNVYSATGTVKRYNITSETEKKKLLNNITNTRGNQSLQEWLHRNWMPVYHFDPSGVIFLEGDGEKAYPTYKSINAIRNYEWKGQNLEWVLFEEKKEKKENHEVITTQRIVDDSFYRTYKVVGDDFTLIEDRTEPNTFGYCPGMISSDITKVGCEEVRESPARNIVEIEQEYLRDQSILTIVKFLNGFKNLVRPKILCPKCHGAKKTGQGSCNDCDGTGFLINRDPTDEIILPIDITNPDAVIPSASDIAAWIGLDVETWDQYRKELEILGILIYETVWGSHQVRNEGERTATEVWINTQPVINRLDKYSKVASHMEWQLTEWIANYQIAKNIDKHVSYIAYGKGFIIDPPNELLRIYSEGKEKQLSPVVLDRQLTEYITAKYGSDPEQLRIELLKMRLDLYIHYTIEQVNEIYGQVEAQKKGLFNEWWESLTIDDYSKSYETLEKSRDEYLNEKTNGEDTSVQVVPAG